MIYGDPQHVAVEVEVDYCQDSTVGHFCYILSGQRVGEFDSAVPLLDFLIATKWILHDCGSRYSSSLFSIEGGSLFERIDSFLYTGGESAKDEAMDDGGGARFDVTPSIEPFNYWKVFLVDGDELSRIVFRREAGMVREVICPRGMFDAAIAAAFDAVESAYELMSGRDE